ncbi:SpaA isopeptide-forming pilin-related protein, partial [Enterococcus florum]|uniref:SpaA isopeptide-forming pilin-related protein n=1 Tax=Enterococcus florum TaxID=2480627 RepID=UPI0011BAD2F0
MSKYIVKGLSLFAVVLFFIQLLPITALSETESTTVETNRRYTLPTKSSDPLKKYSEVGTTASQTTESSQSNEQEAAMIENSDEKPNKKQTKSDAIGPQAEGQDLSSKVVVNSWNIYDSANKALSTTNAAKPDANYRLVFNWSLEPGGSNILKDGDYFYIQTPVNKGYGATPASGRWNVAVNEWAKLEATINGVTKEIGTWRIAPGIEELTTRIEVRFNEGVTGENIKKIEGIEFGMPENSLKNLTLVEGIQNVEFGGVTKPIRFEKKLLTVEKGFDYKTSPFSSNQHLQYDFTVNLAGSVELNGDKVDWLKYPETGFALKGDEMVYKWGENITASNQMYVEDKIEKGVAVEKLTIMAQTRVPDDFPQGAQTAKKGGVLTGLSAFDAYVLVDEGSGPIYKTTGNQATKEPRYPTLATSFSEIQQAASDTEASFRTKVKAAPYQYGVFTKGAGKNAERIVMINFGKVAKSGGQQKKYSDLTESAAATGARARTIKDRNNVNRPILQFAVESADYAIANGFYTEGDRNLLEDYFTLTFGDSNCIGGQIPTYTVSVHLKYNPESTSGVKENTAEYPFQSAVYLDNKYTAKGTGEMHNPYGDLRLNGNIATLFKIDEDTNATINGAEFKLQKKNTNGTWSDVAGQSGLKTGEIEADGSVIYDGAIQIKNMANGTYRFVETKSPDAYDPTKSSDYDSTAKAVISDEFVIPGTTNGPIVYVRNKKKPEAYYKVEHYVQKTAGNFTNWDLRVDEQHFDYVGKTVSASPRVFPGYSFDNTVSGTKVSGVITADNKLVLKLYYVLDDSSTPFKIYKWDHFDKPMPSIDQNGNALKNSQGQNMQVAFNLYEYTANWAAGLEPENIAPPTNPTTQNAAWKLVNPVNKPYVTDSEGKISDKTIDLTNKVYGLVEVSTYPSYKLPSASEAYWIIWSTPGGEIASLQSCGTNNLGTGTFTDSQGKTQYYIKNRMKDGKEPIYKSDETGAIMPSTTLNKVKFKAYQYIGDWNGNNAPDKSPPTNVTNWKVLNGGNEYQTTSAGKILDLVIDAGGSWGPMTYAIMETQTYGDYTIETGSYWVIVTDSNNDKGVFINRIDYIGTNNPGTIEPSKSSTGAWHVKNVPKKRGFGFYKDDENDKPLSGVEFKLYGGKAGETLQMGVNDDPKAANTFWDMSAALQTKTSAATTGRVEFTDLKSGKYLLVETQTAPGYQLPENQWILTIDMTKTGNDQWSIEGRGNPKPPEFNGIRVKNVPKKRGFGFYKDDENDKPLSGVEFKLYGGKAGETLQMGVNDDPKAANTFWDMSAALQTKTSAATTGRVEFTDLKSGKYLLVETKTVPGYQLPENQWILTIDMTKTGNDQWSIEGRGNPKPPEFNGIRVKNVPKTRGFGFYKDDENGQPLSGVEFKLYGGKAGETLQMGVNDDPKAANTFWDMSAALQTKTSAATTGRVEFTDLKSGKYLLVETKTVPGYQLPENQWILTIDMTKTGNDQWSIEGRGNPKPPEFNGIHVKNVPKKRSFGFYKDDENGQPLSGVEFKLYGGKAGETLQMGVNDDPKAANTFWDMSAALQTKTSAATTGRVEFTDLKSGKYLLVETKTVPGYQLPENQWILTIDMTKTGNDQWSIEGRGNPKPPEFNGIHVQNFRIPEKDFSFIKVNEKSNPLGNVEFELYGGKSGETLQIGTNDDPLAANTYWDMTAALQTKSSDPATGRVSFTGLKSGNYLLIETKTVDGYALPTGQWIIQVDASAGTISDPIGRGDPLPPAFYKKSSELYLPNYKEMKMPMAGGIGLHMIVIVGISMIGLSILLLIEKLKK